MFRTSFQAILLVSLSVAVCQIICGADSDPSENEVIKVLTIGNSFANNATEFLEPLGRSGGKSIKLSKANLGGARLVRHATHLAAYEKDSSDPEGSPYIDRDDPNERRYSLVEALQSDEWDFVSLQQQSFLSMDPQSFEPYFGQLVEAIGKHAPDAKILVLQTWAYRRDHRWLQEQGKTPADMFVQVKENYDAIAAKYGLEIIPIGHAFQIARSMRRWYMQIPDPEFNYENPKKGELPDQTGSLNVGWIWRANRETGKKEFALDATHANDAGRYLGACVFYEAITGANSRDLEWCPDSLSDRQAESLREAAHKSIATRNLDTGFVPIFDGKTLNGWDGDPKYWRVEDGALVGEVTQETILQRNSFIIWRGGEPDDFELKVEYRVSGEGNSGLSYRNIQLADAAWSLSGYQADIDGRFHEKRTPRQRYTGQMWEERGRRFLALLGEIVQIDETGQPVVIGSLGSWEGLESAFKEEDWNEYHVIARGNVMTHIINGQVTSIVIDDDLKGRRMKGLIGVQVHTGPPQKIEYRNFRLKDL